MSASRPFGQNIKVSTEIPVYADVFVSGGTANLVDNSHVTGLSYTLGLYGVTFAVMKKLLVLRHAGQRRGNSPVCDVPDQQRAASARFLQR